MKQYKSYTKYRINYPSDINPVFSKNRWWLFLLMILVAILIEPLIIYKHHRPNPLSLDYYFKQLEYILFIAIPLLSFLLWSNWRESVKRRRGYGWIGKFVVMSKRSSFIFCYLMISEGREIKVDRTLFDKTRVGDFIQIRRDALGKIEEISKVKDLAARFARRSRQHQSDDDELG